MSERYGVTYSQRQASLFDKWTLDDPVSIEESTLRKRVSSS